MAELARLPGGRAVQPKVVELAGKTLVQVEALVLLDAPFVHVELAELPDLRHVDVVGE